MQIFTTTNCDRTDLFPFTSYNPRGCKSIPIFGYFYLNCLDETLQGNRFGGFLDELGGIFYIKFFNEIFSVRNGCVIADV